MANLVIITLQTTAKKSARKPPGLAVADAKARIHSGTPARRALWKWTLGSGLILACASVVLVVGTSFGESKRSPPFDKEHSQVFQSPHPIRQGHSETHQSIRRNHKLLDLYVGDVLSFELLDTYPHNKSLFTQGLLFANGHLYEGTGLNGRSEVLQIVPQTGKAVRRSKILNSEHFGEGIALVPSVGTTQNGVADAKLVQISYQLGKGFVYRADDLAGPIHEFQYDTVTGQGWGLAYDESRRELVVSDGSEYIFFWDADTYQEKRYIRVTLPVPPSVNQDMNEGEGKVFLKFINELEVLPGGNFALANVWYDDRVVLINLASGVVEAVYDFRTLRPKRRRGEDCFNGIAFDQISHDFYVTGKMWSSVYRVRLPGLETVLAGGSLGV